MQTDHRILYHNKYFHIINTECPFLMHPAMLSPMPVNNEAIDLSFQCIYYLEDYQLKLKSMLVNGEENDLLNLALSYTGTILISDEPVREYWLKGNSMPCFSYKNVYELIFVKGVLKTTIDHSKAMLRIRKNIELGLRSLNKKRDIRCIERFMNASFIGDYKTNLSNKKLLRYLNEMSCRYTK